MPAARAASSRVEPDDPPMTDLKPFDGVTVLTAAAGSRARAGAGRARVRDATVGALPRRR